MDYSTKIILENGFEISNLLKPTYVIDHLRITGVARKIYSIDLDNFHLDYCILSLSSMPLNNFNPIVNVLSNYIEWSVSTGVGYILVFMRSK